uniref:Uncharacterized protein n=1 Tax=Plectus sambesii TaxID=2011161 RepID=A0A914V0U6_9BILA
MCAGVNEILGAYLFQYCGPFVPVGLVLCGFINTFIYARKHKDIRHAIRVFGVRKVSVQQRASNTGLNFPPQVADAGYVIQALDLHELDSDDLVPQILIRNRISTTRHQLNETFI